MKVQFIFNRPPKYLSGSLIFPSDLFSELILHFIFDYIAFTMAELWKINPLVFNVIFGLIWMNKIMKTTH